MTAPTKMDLAAFTGEQLKTFAAADWERYKTFFTPDAVYDEPATGVYVTGPEAIIAVLRIWKTAYPDLNAVVNRIIPFENGAVVELTWRGTHNGPLPTPEGVVEPTGVYGEVRAVEIINFTGDHMSAMHHYFDMATVLRTGGVLRLS